MPKRVPVIDSNTAGSSSTAALDSAARMLLTR